MIRTDENELYSPIVPRIQLGKSRHIDDIDVVLMEIFHIDVNQARIFGKIHLGVYF